MGEVVSLSSVGLRQRGRRFFSGRDCSFYIERSVDIDSRKGQNRSVTVVVCLLPARWLAYRTGLLTLQRTRGGMPPARTGRFIFIRPTSAFIFLKTGCTGIQSFTIIFTS